MNAVLDGPILADYVPVAKPPWAGFLLALCLVAFVMPRGVLPELVLGAGVAVACVWLVGRYRPSGRTPHDY